MRTTSLIGIVVGTGTVACLTLAGCSSDSGSQGGRTGDTTMTGGSSGSGGTGSGGTTAGGTGGGSTGGTGTGGAGGSGAGGSGSGGTTGGSGGSTTGAGGTGGSTGGSGGSTGGSGGTTGGAGGTTGGAGGTTGGSGGTTGGAGGSTGGSGGTGGSGSGMTYDVSIGPVTLAPGEERIVCVDKKLPTTAAIDMVKITSELTQGGHHLVFYKSGATAEVTTPYTCQTFRDIQSGTVPLYIAQKSSTVLNFPKGVAYAMPAGQMVRVELHFLNATTAPLPVSGTVHVTDAVAGTITDRANLMFWGNLRIVIPPQSTATVGPTFRKFASASPKIFGLTGHEHQRGTGVTIEIASDATSPGTNVYTNTNWSDPPLTIFDPPLVPTAGQGFRYTCTYNNPTSSTITFGEGVNQEMCFLWAYYYPDMGFDIGLSQ
jgi:copper type II ascorbate-dependent monooxygenase-like protein